MPSSHAHARPSWSSSPTLKPSPPSDTRLSWRNISDLPPAQLRATWSAQDAEDAAHDAYNDAVRLFETEDPLMVRLALLACNELLAPDHDGAPYVHAHPEFRMEVRRRRMLCFVLLDMRAEAISALDELNAIYNTPAHAPASDSDSSFPPNATTTVQPSPTRRRTRARAPSSNSSSQPNAGGTVQTAAQKRTPVRPSSDSPSPSPSQSDFTAAPVRWGTRASPAPSSGVPAPGTVSGLRERVKARLGWKTRADADPTRTCPCGAAAGDPA